MVTHHQGSEGDHCDCDCQLSSSATVTLPNATVMLLAVSGSHNSSKTIHGSCFPNNSKVVHSYQVVICFDVTHCFNQSQQVLTDKRDNFPSFSLQHFFNIVFWPGDVSYSHYLPSKGLALIFTIFSLPFCCFQCRCWN